MLRKSFLVLTIIFYLCATGGAMGTEATQKQGQFTDETAKAFLVQLFSEAFDPKSDPKLIARKYLTEDYIQLVDGKTLSYDGFVEHLEVLLDTLESIKFTFEQVITSGNIIADIHVVDAVKKGGEMVKVKVFAFFFMRGNKIAKIDELTFQMEGSEDDKNLGSRTKSDK